ncbi:tyrosinase family protein [Cohnella nanjingensis]|uniref:Tyrosinase family protein n=1 Tax=Cohnella nanjingensis TaxID=1387779 RepID=A0A7X0RVL1_9BACL|nr:tyrosinase family protein [Cohnella nanjingensis]MBB6674493.1 tyrosinase family protein [Cohnella nanjingensis]
MRGAVAVPTIPNFPQALLDEHMNWHHANHVNDPSKLPPGYGQAFLQFHRNYIRKAIAWYNQQGYDPALVAPWNAVPEPIRQSRCYNQQVEARILYQPQTIRSVEELGRLIEGSGLHGCIHQGAGELYGDSDMFDFDVAPRSTLFYNIHGMIDRWYQNWEGQGRFAEGLSFWNGRFEREDDEMLRYVPADGAWQFGRVEGTELVWHTAGDSCAFGALDDGRPFRVWDADGDGRLEVLFQQPADGSWWEGRVRDGKLVWGQVRVSLKE